MAPVCDNNRSLLFDLDADQLDYADHYSSRLAPRLGSDYMVVAKALIQAYKTGGPATRNRPQTRIVTTKKPPVN